MEEVETGERDWGSLVPELFASVLQKVQEGAGHRGEGRRVVALAGVCRSWRRAVLQEFHRHPPALLSFRGAIRQPAPSGSSHPHPHRHLQCVLKKSGDTFRLFQILCGDEYFLLGARKKYTIGSSYFKISTDPRILWTQGRHDDAETVTSNFWRTAFTFQDTRTRSSSKSILATKYEEIAVDGNCLRKMRCEFGPAGSKVSAPDTGKISWWPPWFTAMLKWNHLLNFTSRVNHIRKTLKSCAPLSPQSPETVKKIGGAQCMNGCFP